MMKKILYLTFALCVFACAKPQTLSTNQKEKVYFDSWVQLYRSEAFANGLQGWGFYFDPTQELVGTGAPVKDSAFVRVKYTAYDLEGNILVSSNPDKHRQLGDYDTTYYYGPTIWNKGDVTAVPAGIRSVLSTMNVGGKRTAIVPSWLMIYEDHDNGEAYFNSSTTGGKSSIYEIEIVEATNNISRWELDSLHSFAASNPVYKYRKSDADVPLDKARFVRCSDASKDTTGGGYYYQQLKKADKEKALPIDTTIYVNYIGRLLDGRVFDTNIQDTAIVHHLYSSSATYTPMQVRMATNFFDIKSISTSDGSESSLINGFTYALKHMKPGEHGVALFYSGMGYSYTATERIPSYCPLMFELQLVPQP